jgi:endonuclease/exonuclease/phosphatase (EEP) superfamily protein YafD
MAGESPGPELRVLTWNLEVDSKPASETVAGIAGVEADVVALQELTPAVAAAIDADAGLRGRYPYRILEPLAGAEGLGVLARSPLLVRGLDDRSRVLRAGLLLDDGRTLELLVVHPSRPPFGTTFSIPRSLDTRRRDEDLARIRELVDALDDPAGVLVVGDFNATSTEPGMAVLDGLTDAHLAVGGGPGFTWRPDAMEATGLALLRIDAVRSGSWLTPLTSELDCALAGDHCRLLVTLRVEAPAG